MRAKTVFENIEFKRGRDPKRVLGIGRYYIPSVKELLYNVKWAQSKEGWDPDLEKFKKWRENAMKPDKSDAYRKYIEFCIIPGHITPNASSVLLEYLKNSKEGVTRKELENILKDMGWEEDGSSYNEMMWSAQKYLNLN